MLQVPGQGQQRGAASPRNAASPVRMAASRAYNGYYDDPQEASVDPNRHMNA